MTRIYTVDGFDDLYETAEQLPAVSWSGSNPRRCIIAALAGLYQWTGQSTERARPRRNA